MRPFRHAFFSLPNVLHARSRWGFSSPSHAGQALSELVIALVTLIILILGITTLAQICLRQTHLQRALRLEAGTSALKRSTHGWAEASPLPENRSDTFHRINALTRLEQYTPALTSRLPMSHYTLAARSFPEADLGLTETTVKHTFLLDEGFVRWIYGKGTVTLQSDITFPALSGITE